MYPIIHDLLADRKGGEIFVLFGGWHFFYMLAAVTIVVCVLLRTQRGDDSFAHEVVMKKEGAFLCDLGFYLYIADFFLMPFAYEEIDIEKLPFHVCTAMCVMCFISRRSENLRPYHGSFALLGFVSNLVYLIYPAGVMWHAVHPLSYRVIQTLAFHAIMTAGCTITILSEEFRPGFANFRKHAEIVFYMTLWAVIGNLLYYGSAGKYDNDFNWFFVTADPFGLIDRSWGVLIMPFVTMGAFVLAEAAVCLVFMFVRRRNENS